jgi:antitoxin YefM
MQSVSISTLRGQIKKYCDLVTENFETVIISRTKTEDSVVMISLSEYNSIQETLHLLSTQANRDRLAESMAQAKAGHLVQFPEKGGSADDR